MANRSHRPNYDRAVATLKAEIDRLQQRQPEKPTRPESAWWRMKRETMRQVLSTLHHEHEAALEEIC